MLAEIPAEPFYLPPVATLPERYANPQAMREVGEHIEQRSRLAVAVGAALTVAGAVLEIRKGRRDNRFPLLEIGVGVVGLGLAEVDAGRRLQRDADHVQEVLDMGGEITRE